MTSSPAMATRSPIERTVWPRADARAPHRSAHLLVPRSGCVRALAVELHGSGLDVRRQRSMSRLADRLLRDDIAVLLPEGAIPFRLKPELEPGFAWNVPGTPLPGSSRPVPSSDDDLGWIDDLVQAARHDLGLGEEPLLLAGYSGGARLASHLLVKGRSRWAAAGLVAGLRAIEGGDRAPPPTLSVHGTEDAVNPYAGGGGSRWDSGVEEAGDRYARAQGCLAGYREDGVPGGRRRVYAAPLGHDALILHAVANAAHAWPGSTDPDHLRTFGPAGAGIDASAMIAAFFLRHIPADERRRAGAIRPDAYAACAHHVPADHARH